MKKNPFFICIVIFFCLTKLSGMSQENPNIPATNSLWGAAINDNAATIASLVEAGAKVDQPCGNPQHTPLYWAAAFGSIEAIQMLLSLHANPNLRLTKDDETPLVIAAIIGYPDIVRLLLEYNADSQLTCQWEFKCDLQSANQTALELAQKQRRNLQMFSTGCDALKELYAGTIQKLDAVITILEERERILPSWLFS
ncbi:MAG: ankyrin repeat domain-containing protein [Candidatus Babeliales bacterium]|jgi:ankyrin repeat protein